MTDKVQKIREEVERLKSQLLRGACSSQVAIETRCKEEAYNEVLGILDTMQEEPTSVWHDASEEPDNKKNIVIWANGFSNLIAVEEYRPKEKKFYYEFGDHYYNVDITRKGLIWAYVDELLNFAKKEKPVSEDLDKAALEYANKQLREAGVTDDNCPRELAVAQASLMVSGFKAGVNWQKQQMMTKSIKAVVSQVPCSNEIILYNPSSVDKYYLPQEMNKLGLNKGDKVKLIIIKED